MLKWEPGLVADWDGWNGWHESLVKSEGFKKKSSQEDFEKLPIEVEDCIKDNIGYYMFLQSRKIKVSKSSISNLIDFFCYYTVLYIQIYLQ